MIELFAKATRLKYRFSVPTTKAYQVTIEDLWDIPLTTIHQQKPSLDIIAKGLSIKIRELEDESFVSKPSDLNTELTEKLDIIKYIIKFKLDDIKAKSNAKIKKSKITELEEIIKKKQLEEITSKSIDEIKKEIEALKSS